MKKSLSVVRLLAVVLVSFTSLAFADSERPDVRNAAKRTFAVDPATLKLTYDSFDGTFSYPCTAKQTYEDNPYDFTVQCFNGNKLVKKVDLHLSIDRYDRTFAPRTQYEILFWVNGEGATTWLKFDETTRMNRYEGSQTIAGEPSLLRMKLNF